MYYSAVTGTRFPQSPNQKHGLTDLCKNKAPSTECSIILLPGHNIMQKYIFDIKDKQMQKIQPIDAYCT
jgi:hypothetical protein